MKIAVSKVLVLVSGLVGVILYWLAFKDEYWHTESSDNNLSQSSNNAPVRMLIMLRNCDWLFMPAAWSMMMLSYCKLHRASTMHNLPYWLKRFAIAIFIICIVIGLLEMYRFTENIGLSCLCISNVCTIFTVFMMCWHIYHGQEMHID